MNIKYITFTTTLLFASINSYASIENKYTPLEMSDINRPFYQRFINSQPITNYERENPDKYLNYNLFAFSKEGNNLNKRNLYFINNYLSERAYVENNIPLLFNINNHISGQIHTLNQEKNPVRKRINIESFFEENKNHYGTDFNPYEFFDGKILYNEINLQSSTEYIYEDKKILIELGNDGDSNSNISFYCSDELKFAYIIGNNIEERSNISSVNNNTRVYISLSDEIKSILKSSNGNRCMITKQFSEHEEAIDFMDVLNDSRSRFILKFKINENQSLDSFYLKGTSHQFGLYSFRNNFMNLYDDFDTDSEYQDIDFINNVFKTVKDKGFFDYQDIFDIENYYNTEMFYPTRIGYIRFDTDSGIAYLIKDGDYKIRYKMIKENNHYKFSLYKIDFINTYNFPIKFYFRKLHDGFDLFTNYSYDFNSNIIRVGDTSNPNVRY